MKRREFINLAGGAIAWPLAARAQHDLPEIGFLGSSSERQVASQLNAFRKGLNETGFTEGKNVAIEFRWAEGQFHRLPAMATEFVRRHVSLILAQAPPAALAAKAATTSMPIVFVVGLDPVGAGLVADLNHPGGNATGMSLVSDALGEKRLEMVRDLVPKSSVVAMLANPVSPDTVVEIRSIQKGAETLGLKLELFNASTPSEIEEAFDDIAKRRPDALIIGTDPFFLNQRAQIIMRAARLPLPTIYPFREFIVEGGLVSYGTNLAHSYRQAGIYAGRVLKGAVPAELPVMQPTTFELVINLKTASALHINVPPTLHARSDEVIE